VPEAGSPRTLAAETTANAFRRESKNSAVPIAENRVVDYVPSREPIRNELTGNRMEPSFDIAEPTTEEKTITRPWEVEDSPRRLLTAPNPREVPKHSNPTGEIVEQLSSHEGAIRPQVHPTVLADNAENSSSLRETSPVPASRLVAPASPPRSAACLGSQILFGSAAEYRQRDGFTYSVRTLSVGVPKRSERAATPRTARVPRERKESKPDSGSDERQPRSAVAPRPFTTSEHLQRTAPSRWFRPNPLRVWSLEQQSLRGAPYVQQASAETPVEETSFAEEGTLAQQSPATETLEPLPSFGEDQPLPFDLNAAEKEIGTKENSAPNSPAERKASEPVEDNLSLDDLPFGDSEKETPTANKEPNLDSLFPESSSEKAPAAKNRTQERASEPNSDAELPFPFDLPKAEQMPAKVPEQQVPALKSPVESQVPEAQTPAGRAPLEELPFGESAVEASPGDRPATQPFPVAESAPAEPNPNGLKSIFSIATSTSPPAGELPANRFPSSSDEAPIVYGAGRASRGWAVSEYNWEATAMFHQPLYFEEVNLERYGYTHGIAQPAISYGQFLVNVIAMPYKVMAEPPREEVYTLGHYRPGSYAPYRIHYPPASVSGGLFEAGVVLGLVFLIP
jgi:hypothetical protein